MRHHRLTDGRAAAAIPSPFCIIPIPKQFQRGKQFNAAAGARQAAAHADNSQFIDEQRSRQHVSAPHSRL